MQQRISEAIRKGTQAAGWKQYMKSSSLIEGLQGPEEYTAFIGKQDAVTSHWLKNLGLEK